MYNTKIGPRCELLSLGDNNVSVWFIDYNKCITPVWTWDIEEGYM